VDGSQIGRALVVFGVLLVIVGALFMLGQRLGLGRLPGDISIKREGFTLHAPLATSIVVSVILTLLLNFWARR
jgi:hypothetical protein